MTIRRRVYEELGYSVGFSTQDVCDGLPDLTRPQVVQALVSLRRDNLVESWDSVFEDATLWARVGATDQNRPEPPR